MKKTSSALITITIFITTIFSAAVFSRGVDSDGDGVPDSADNCSEVANADQRNTDGDDFGNRCDPDFNNDNFVNFTDLTYFQTVFFTPDPDADLDGSGLVNFIDLAIVGDYFFGPPGPGAVAGTVTYTGDVQPILGLKCMPCHTDFNIGGHNIGNTYQDAFLLADDFNECTGLNIAECSLVLIQNGEMPADAGCTGNPVLDAGVPACLTQDEQDTIQAWLDGGLLE